ncbi:MAG TPA: PHP domain-containing protein [Phycisphaerae bacterium]|nr:PHP domain-containing protein [Phycisphaerae bacterium]HOI55493.1 PHP domain-containing protein [Phycisphaerae bacterium]
MPSKRATNKPVSRTRRVAKRTTRRASAAGGSSRRRAKRVPSRSGAAAGGKTGANPRPEVRAASSLEAYQELEKALYVLRDALEAAGSYQELTELLAARCFPANRIAQLADLGLGGDLHLHSSVSDGKVPPRKLPWLARALGLHAIALTDHDSVDGCREAFREGMLIGVRVICGVELSTDQPGLEILVYFPDTGKLFSYLQSSGSSRFRNVLKRRQSLMHEKSLACLDHVNRWLRRQKVPVERLITLEEYDRWYEGRQPYFPGTLCVLGLARLSPAQRSSLRIHDPRTFHTKVVTPFLKSWSGGRQRGQAPDLTAESFALVRSALRAGIPAATVMAHPKELVTKGHLSLGAVRKHVFDLADSFGLDGIEVACARDNETDVRYWMETVKLYNASVAEGGPGRKPLLAASHSSDFHVLGPGVDTGEITLGFGVLDSRPPYRRGNLRPQMPLDEFLEQLQRRAGENV